MKRIAFCGGGSAGHVVPNLALMEQLKYSYKLFYIGTDGIEKRLVPSAFATFYEVNCPKLIRSITLKNLTLPIELRKAKKKALALLEEIKPDLLFSKGGFAAYPAVWAAHHLKIPVFTHESDLTPGLCTKMIAKKCEKVFTSFPETAALFENGECVSSPMRKQIFQGDQQRALHKYGFSSHKPVLLVLGGGSGSKALNDAVLSHLDTLLTDYQILHLCGKGNLSPSQTGYVCKEFEPDMGSAYAAANVLLCRAGSNTVFESLALKKKTLFVPLEKGSRGDQLQNALYFYRKGLCHLLHEQDLNALPIALQTLNKDENLTKNLKTCTIKNGTPYLIEKIKRRVNQLP